MGGILFEAHPTGAQTRITPTKDFLIWPLSGNATPDTARVSSPFGPRWQASQHRYDYHPGIDIAAPLDTPVHAVADGAVFKVGWLSQDAGLGVIISHSQLGLYSAYLHLASTPPLTVGQIVTQGQVIGYVGNSGTTEFYHLHFEVRLSAGHYPTSTRNPMGYLPHPDVNIPTIRIASVQPYPIYSPTVSLTITAPRSELDVNQVRVTMFDRVTGDKLDDQLVDFNQRIHTGSDTLDQDGIQLIPAHFNITTHEYVLTAKFYNLHSWDSFTLTAQAVDLAGHASIATTTVNVWSVYLPLTLKSGASERRLLVTFFDHSDSFQVIAGQAPIAVGAPHHGLRPNVDADQGTGPIALALATRLGASAVIVSDMRRIVDVNKNPLHLGRLVRQYALRYQNRLFQAGPRLAIEVHGHVSGQYAIELATGFNLDPNAPGDARFLKKLATLKQALPDALAGKIGQSPTVGVYPLDRDVNKTATNTFTFQKIRRARNLAGLEWYGLHIELAAELRTTPKAKSAAFVEALADALAISIRTAFEPLPSARATLSTRADQPDGLTTLLSPRTLAIALAPEKYVNENIVAVHPSELEALGALDGDAVIVRHGQEEIASTITSLLSIRPGRVGMPARLRRQISVSEHGRVVVGRPAPATHRSPQSRNAVVVHESRREAHAHQVWLAPDEIQRMGLQTGHTLSVQAQPDLPPANSVMLLADASLPPHSADGSSALMEQMVLTLGEVITLS